MKPQFLFAITIFWLCISCSQTPINANANMFQNKSFVHLFYETEKECMEAQPDPDFFTNCHQQVDFKKNNEVVIMLSDVLWKGKYRVEGDQLILTFENTHEISGGTIIYEILHPGLLLKADDNTMWKKLKGKNIWK